jgi:predicted nucleic acid-binding Zn ribbon protein
VPDNDAERRLAAARDALEAAIGDARARGAGSRPARSAEKKSGSGGDREARADPARRKGRSAAGQGSGDSDPQPLAAAISKLLADRGWQQQAAVSSAFGRWEEIVGAELAAHARPEGLHDGELVVIADSTAWATQLRLLAGPLVRRLNAELGDGAVRRVRVRGPEGPRRQPGGWRVPGSRGPRDTYG